MTGSFPSAGHALARCSKNILPCALAVALWATMSTQSCAGTIYRFITDTSPAPNAPNPTPSNLTGFLVLGSSGNLVTYDFSCFGDFTPADSGFAFSSGGIVMYTTTPPTPSDPFTYSLAVFGLGDKDPNSSVYFEDVNVPETLLVTSGLGHWTVQQFVPEPSTITLAFFAAVCGIVYAVARKRRAQRKATRESQAFAASA